MLILKTPNLIQRCFIKIELTVSGLPIGSVVKNLPANEGDTGDTSSIPVLGRSPGGGNNLLLDNPMDRGALVGYSPWGHKELDTTECTHIINDYYNINNH